MTTENTQEWQESTNGANEWGGTEVTEESQIVMETEGEGFTGTYLEMDPPNANGIVQAHIEDGFDLEGQPLGERLFINAPRDLVSKLRKVPKGAEIRVQWVSSMNTGQKTPMRVFKVQWR
jgi:(2Fe-2S) ferredoxin